MNKLRRPRRINDEGTEQSTSQPTEHAHGVRETEVEAAQRTPTLLDLPLTPAMTTALTREATRCWRAPVLAASVVGAIGVIGPIIGVIIGGPVNTLLVIPFFVILAIGIAFSMLRSAQQKIRADVLAGRFLRVTGVSEVQYVHRAGEYLTVGQQTFFVGGSEARTHLRPRAWRSIDFSPQAHVIFEARDVTGQVVYRAPSYEPAGTA